MTPRKNYTVSGINFGGRFMAYSAFRLLTERPRTRDELIHALWGMNEPSNAEGTLRALLNRVRQVIEPHGLTVPRGNWNNGVPYVFHVAPIGEENEGIQNVKEQPRRWKPDKWQTLYPAEP